MKKLILLLFVILFSKAYAQDYKYSDMKIGFKGLYLGWYYKEDRISDFVSYDVKIADIYGILFGKYLKSKGNQFWQIKFRTGQGIVLDDIPVSKIERLAYLLSVKYDIKWDCYYTIESGHHHYFKEAYIDNRIEFKIEYYGGDYSETEHYYMIVTITDKELKKIHDAEQLKKDLESL